MEQIFLEPNEEITSVIDKLATASGGKIAVVVPKNSTLFQSLVNLKLLAKQANELGKEVVLITGNKVGQRLASQVGIEAYANLGTIKEPVRPNPPAALTSESIPETLPDGTPIRRYVPPQTQNDPETETSPTPEPVATNEPVAETVPVVESAPNVEPTVVSADEPEPAPVIAKEVTHPEEAPELPAIVSRTPTVRREFHFQLPWKSLLAAAVLLLIAFGVTYTLLPKATVTVTLPAKAVSETLDVAIRSVAADEENSLTGNLLSVDKSLTKPIAATGKKDIGTKATGTIAYRNCEDSQAHTVAAGTKTTASGKTFTTNAALTIPAGSFSGGGSVCNSSSVNVTVTAEAAGETYNLSNASFTIAGLSSRISGSGTTAGGTTKQVSVLTQADVDAGIAALEKQATDEATAELTTKAEGQTLLDGSITQVTKTRSSDKKVGDQVDSATVTLVATISVIVFDKTAVEAKLHEALQAKIEAGQKLEIPDDKPPTTVFKEYSADKTVLTVTVSGDGYGVPDVGKQEISKQIRHASVSAAEALLKEKYQATEVKVEMTPSWWLDRLPLLSGAITVEYGFNEVTAEPVVSP